MKLCGRLWHEPRSVTTLHGGGVSKRHRNWAQSWSLGCTKCGASRDSPSSDAQSRREIPLCVAERWRQLPTRSADVASMTYLQGARRASSQIELHSSPPSTILTVIFIIQGTQSL